jgi:peroxiredoxin
MRFLSLVTLATFAIGSFVSTSMVRAEAKVGEPAPSFTLQDQTGKTVSLSDFVGKVVVLEWFNDQCPFVQKHYKTGAMNNLAAKYGKEGVVWLAVNSSNFTTNDKNAAVAKDWNIDRPILNDASGATGKAYGAKTTPGMYVIGKDGKLLYAGAIDSIDDDETSSLSKATNYVGKALDEILADKPVTTPETKSYGCSVKYKK